MTSVGFLALFPLEMFVKRSVIFERLVWLGLRSNQQTSIFSFDQIETKLEKTAKILLKHDPGHILFRTPVIS